MCVTRAQVMDEHTPIVDFYLPEARERRAPSACLEKGMSKDVPKVTSSLQQVVTTVPMAYPLPLWPKSPRNQPQPITRTVTEEQVQQVPGSPFSGAWVQQTFRIGHQGGERKPLPPGWG